MKTSLNLARRARELEELAERPSVDVLVIGGGVTGAGVALDAATRGLSVVLAEKHDLAFGTSRWSSKLVHGGLRYLATGQVGIAYESAVERGILIAHTAPHLVRPMPQVFPLNPTMRFPSSALVRAGLSAGDVLRAAARTPARTLPRSRRISAAEVCHYAPGVRVDGLRGGLLSWDGQLEDDARLVVALARTAAGFGAKVLTRMPASEASGSGAVLSDSLAGQQIRLSARVVINATGVWAGQLAPGLRLRPSRGTHLVISRQALGGLSCGLMVPVPGHLGRSVFALPAPDERAYIGITDEDSPGPIPDVPSASDSEIDFLLETINLSLAAPLTRAEVLGTFSGLRPLLDTGTGATADISRKHQVITSDDGMVTVVGGKLTTYRRMAQDALDAGLAQAGLTAGRCLTTQLPVVGAARRRDLSAVRAPARLIRRYGTEAAQVLAAGGGHAEGPVAAGTQVTMAELLFAVRHEGALDVADLLERRTRIALDPNAGAAAVPAAESALARA